jgi:hypothetical protein
MSCALFGVEEGENEEMIWIAQVIALWISAYLSSIFGGELAECRLSNRKEVRKSEEDRNNS